MNIIMLYSTFPSRGEAVLAAKNLLEARHIACANITDGMTALYHWDGVLQEVEEAVLLAKTTQAHMQAAMDALRSLHPYDTPCIVAWDITAGWPEFLRWVEGEVISYSHST